MSSLGVSRLRIVKYFDDLKTTVDECVETFIAANHLDKKLETEINQVRAGWLSEIDESEKFNLTELQKREDKHSKLEDEVLFKKFMFAFELPEGEELIDLRIVAIDEYASRGKVECLQILLKLAANTIDKSVFEEKIRKLFLSNEITVNIYSGVIYVVGSLVKEWRRSLDVIRVASLNQLSIVAAAHFYVSVHAIQPNAQFLFHKTHSLEIMVYIASAVDTSTSVKSDPFAAMHSMLNLNTLELRIVTDNSVTRVDHFTPLLPNLRHLSVLASGLVEFGPTAFDHLNYLSDFTIHSHREKSTFETGLMPPVFKCSGFQLLKLNWMQKPRIGMLTTSGMVESMLPLTSLSCLSMSSLGQTTDLSRCFFHLTYLRSLTLNLCDLSQVERGQLSRLSNLTSLVLGHTNSKSKTTHIGTGKLSGDGDMFKGLVSLTELDIHRFKSLHVIECGAFKHLSNTLECIDLSMNSIETIEQGAFKCLSKLRSLRLTENRLNNEQLEDLKTNGELPSAVIID